MVRPHTPDADTHPMERAPQPVWGSRLRLRGSAVPGVENSGCPPEVAEHMAFPRCQCSLPGPALALLPEALTVEAKAEAVMGRR